MQPPNGCLCRLQSGRRRKPYTRRVRRTSPHRAGEAHAGRIAATSPMGHHSAMVRAILAWMLAVATAAASAQSIVKCVDAAGNVTYQDSPCTPGEAGRSVELPKAETREDTSAWEAAARSGRVVRRHAQALGAALKRRARRDPARRPLAKTRRKCGGTREGRQGSRGLRGARTSRGCATTRARCRLRGPRQRPRLRHAAAAPAPSTRGAQNRTLRHRRPLLRARLRGDRRRRPGGDVARIRAERRGAGTAGRASATTTSPPPATRRCARCSAASTEGSPTSSAPSCVSHAWPLAAAYFVAASACACSSLTVAL